MFFFTWWSYYWGLFKEHSIGEGGGSIMSWKSKWPLTSYNHVHYIRKKCLQHQFKLFYMHVSLLREYVCTNIGWKCATMYMYTHIADWLLGTLKVEGREKNIINIFPRTNEVLHFPRLCFFCKYLLSEKPFLYMFSSIICVRSKALRG